VSAKATRKQSRLVVLMTLRKLMKVDLEDDRLIVACEEFFRAALLVDAANWPLSAHESGADSGKPASRQPGRELYPSGVRRLEALAGYATDKALACGRLEYAEAKPPTFAAFDPKDAAIVVAESGPVTRTASRRWSKETMTRHAKAKFAADET
jgi:hypothetical protein